MSDKVRVIVEVSGGIVQNVFAGPFVEVLVIDHDNMEGPDGDPFPAPGSPDQWNAYADDLWSRGEAASQVAHSDDFDDEPFARCTSDNGHHDFQCTGTAYGGDDSRWFGEGRMLCSHCGADGDA